MNVDYFIDGLATKDPDVLDKLYAIFGNMKNFIFGYVYKKGRLKDVDLSHIYYAMDEGEIWHFGEICNLYLKEFGPDFFIPYFNVYNTSYVTKEGKNYYVNLKYLSDIRDLFIGPNMDFISDLFGEDWYEPFYAETNDLYEDVVSVLNKENKKYLAKVILEKTKGITLSESDIIDYSDGSLYIRNGNVLRLKRDVLLDYVNEHGVFNFHENINAIMNNEDDLFNEVIMMNYFGELQRELENLYSISYNEAWNEEMMDIVLDSISEYFDPNIRWEGDLAKIRIRFFGTALKQFFDSATDEGITEFNDYLYFISSLQRFGIIDEFKFRELEFPDFEKVNEEINERFFDYIE